MSGVKQKNVSRAALRGKKKQGVDQIEVEIAALDRRIREEAPLPGTNPLASDAFSKAKDVAADDASAKDAGAPVSFPAARKFVHFPISQRTQDALVKNNFIRLTDIQRASLPHALCGRDILGAAKTGSGKTLAFAIPVIERLFRSRWSVLDGLGALIISPTRELAVQIFEVFRKVGSEHDLSAGLLIGGKSFDEEAKRILSMNILICTPGRLLQHMDQTPGFNCDNLQVLVLDEADRILDLGFEATVLSIVQNLPESRQTLLFSATQTKSVKQLAKLSLKEPEYVAVHDSATEATPIQLVQTYMLCEAHQKFDVLYSFIRTHLKSKYIVFVSSCKQVRFLFEAFRRLHPGVPLMEIHGKMKQSKRMAIYYDFVEKPAAVLFSTDVAARGLDFPGVDWVVQFDCPDSVASYIHRAGRTARYKSTGNGLLLLLPSESAILDQMQAQRIPIKKVKVNPEKLQSTAAQFASALAESADLKYLAQKSFITYMRSVFLQSDKTIFNVLQIDAEQLSAAMGLPGTPNMKFAKGSTHGDKNLPVALRELMEKDRLKEAAGQGDEGAALKLKQLQDEKRKKKNGDDAQSRRIDKLLHRQSSSVYADARTKIVRDDDGVGAESSSDEAGDSDDDGDDAPKSKSKAKSLQPAEDNDDADADADLFHFKRRDHDLASDAHLPTGAMSRKQAKLAREAARGIVRSLDDDSYEVQIESEAPRATGDDFARHLKHVGARLKVADVDDKVHEHERVKGLHQKQKAAEKLKNQRYVQGRPARIGGDDEDGGDEDDDEGEDGDDDEDEGGDDDEAQDASGDDSGANIDLNEDSDDAGNDDDEDDDDEDEDEDEQPAVVPVATKRKAHGLEDVASNAKHRKVATDRSLRDEEQLALQILARRK